jgi:Ran GTPase-activating protein (RanGAP) involved in mRNA processing and transport
MSIELNHNSIGDDGCAALAATLRDNTVLTKISLIGNGIGQAGAIALAERLRANARLRELGLGRNGLGNEEAVAIAKALRFEMQRSVGTTYLRGNSISDKGR